MKLENYFPWRPKSRAVSKQENSWIVSNNLPILDTVEALLIGDVVHQNESHSASVVGCGDGAVALLPCRVLKFLNRKRS